MELTTARWRQPRMNKPRRPFALVVAPAVAGALALSACSSTTTATPGASTPPGSAASSTVTKGTAPGTTSGSTPGSTPGSNPAAKVDEAGVVKTYGSLVEKSYAASVASTKKLQTSIDTFVATPTEANLEAAKKQWLAARDDYGPTEAFRFYDGPIDEPEKGPEGQINAWPMDEAYVDYVDGATTKGIIGDPVAYPDITKDVILEANEKDGETNISTGWHAIEFLLWGQDLNADGAGTRPVTDYTTEANAKRRGAYLDLLADVLVDDLTGVAEQWAPNVAGNYRATFEKSPTESLGKIFRGIGALTAGELAGERMGVAFDTKDQEDEHSCFSDNTSADVKNNAIGVQRVYTAKFPGVSGPSLADLVAAKSPETNAKLTAKLDATVKATSNFPATFEKMIAAEEGSADRKALKDAITALEEQGELIADAAKALGVTVNFEV